MWGRIDGAGWLVHLLLDPRRINSLTTEKTSRAEAFHDRLVTALGASAATSDSERALRASVLAELCVPR